jgi:hypothetical protein
MRIALAGCREPVVLVLLLIAFFSTISGKPLDGLLMLAVGVALACDVSMRVSRGSAAAGPLPAADVGESPDAARRHGWRRAAAWSAVLAAGTGYAIVVGSFPRFSWPATAAVLGLCVAALLSGWPDPRRPRPDPGPLPRAGAAAWAGLLVGGGLWELAALLQQPSLTVTARQHPTLSALTDPLLASAPGRSVALGIWLALGWWLVRR